MTKVKELTDFNFESEIKNTNDPVIVDFFAPWCGHCRVQEPIIEELADEFMGEAIIAKLNVDENMEKAAQYFISGIPAILVFKNGQLVEQKSGLQQKNELKKLIEKHKNN